MTAADQSSPPMPRRFRWDRSLRRWVEGGAGTIADAPAGELLVADSWLVRDRRVRAPRLHLERFTASCMRHWPEADVIAEAFSATAECLPPTREWWPRIELLRTPDARLELQLLVRPNPPAPSLARVAIAASDPRSQPHVKGPDLAALAKLREHGAVEHGADEMLLLDADGAVVDAAGAAVAWWEGERLCLVGADHAALPSVTATLLRRIATETGVPVGHGALRPIELAARETWLLSVRIGIVPVGEWIAVGGGRDLPGAPVDRERLARWRAALDALAEPF